MTKRYYYDCPIEAAYMAKNFRIIIENPDPREKTSIHFKCNDWAVYYTKTSEVRDMGEGSWTDVKWREGKYYIHPDSEHILQPKDYDLLGYLEAINPERSITIMRNNKPFIWPKCEDNT